LDQVRASSVLNEIFKKYDKLCLVIDEAKNTALVTTRPFAAKQGLKPVSLAP